MIVTGVITLIGDGIWNDGVTKTSIMEIGGKKFRDLAYSSGMSTYLKRAYSNGSEVTLVIVRRVIAYLYSDGDECDDTGNPIAGLILILLGIPLLPLLLYGLGPIMQGVFVIRSRSERNKVNEMISKSSK
ncbi:hypothetical protein [Asticcacaulis sp.]|uniref:hypothetical protein n=1 Tax=Asticcacaulis sp. TaxID=1872648 RepID=UPI002612A79C|nr:hypothetical protein [Asticcacaulis sp.]